MNNKVVFEKRELVNALWAYFRAESREDSFFDVMQVLTEIEENQIGEKQ